LSSLGSWAGLLSLCRLPLDHAMPKEPMPEQDRIRFGAANRGARDGVISVACTSAKIYRFISDEPPTSVSALLSVINVWSPGVRQTGTQQWLNWAIRRLEDGQCVGYIQATIHPGGTADFAFVLGSMFWGLGLAREASFLALSTLFGEFGVISVFATADRRNLRSSGLLRRLGFVQIQAASYPHGNVSASDDVFPAHPKSTNQALDAVGVDVRRLKLSQQSAN